MIFVRRERVTAMRHGSPIERIPSTRRGFTLVEMVLVITIMAIMLGSVIPNFKPFMESATIKDAASTLAQMIRYTRSLAVEQSACVEMAFDSETGDIWVSIESDPINSPGIYEPIRLPVDYPKKYRTDIQVAGVIKQTLSGSQEDEVISFLPDGTTSDTFVYLTDKYEQIATIGIVGLTGQVMVWNFAAQSFYE